MRKLKRKEIKRDVELLTPDSIYDMFVNSCVQKLLISLHLGKSAKRTPSINVKDYINRQDTILSQYKFHKDVEDMFRNNEENRLTIFNPFLNLEMMSEELL